jgi:hypothetical protein
MKELLRSNDLVYLSFVSHVLDEAGIDFLVLDGHMSAVEGSIGAIPAAWRFRRTNLMKHGGFLVTPR